MLRAFMEERLMVYLMQLKITPNLKGYKYIKEAAIRICENSSKKYNLSKTLYKELSDEFDEKLSLLDRALRHAVEVSYKRNGIQDFEIAARIEFSDSKPSVKEVICVLAEKLSMDIKGSPIF